jgi:hypothetical protein
MSYDPNWRELGLPSPGVPGNPNWKKGGPSGNPNGRPKSYKFPPITTKVTHEIFEEAARRGYTHPVIYMLEVMHDPTVSDQRRDTMAACAAPWMTPKYGKDERFISENFQVPATATVEEAQKFLDELPRRVRDGELDFQSAQEFSILIARALMERRAREELDLKRYTASADTSEQHITVSGGLPPLPGTNITMPLINGHPAIDGTMLPSPDPTNNNDTPAKEESNDGSYPPAHTTTTPPGP